MDDSAAGRKPLRQPPMPVLGDLGLAISRSAGAARVIASIQASLLLLLLVGCATLDWRVHRQLERDRQAIIAAHPEWPPEILAAMASGVICAGMSPDMVRAAWGHPTRISSNGSGSNQYETWHYARRQHAAEMIGGQGDRARPIVEWTVSFAHAGVMGWTD